MYYFYYSSSERENLMKFRENPKFKKRKLLYLNEPIYKSVLEAANEMEAANEKLSQIWNEL